jgi:phosphopantothenoylcysteine decarboxylase / phosphopantothenate---cysteine ligase
LNIVVAATGGVAAIKTPSLIRRLSEAGHELRAAATDDSYHFITKLSLAVAAGSPVFDREAWFYPGGRARHIELARWADVMLVAPATADALASAAGGRADDVVCALVLAGVPRVVWVPAMNTAMWEHPAVKENVEKLRSFGHLFLGPASGPLAARGEGSGMGRMIEPEEIVRLLVGLLKPKDLIGERILVSAGPTREHLDPVRFLSNPSSGKMGYAVAEAARDRGARVTLVSGPTALDEPYGVDLVGVETATQMLDALAARFDEASVLVMTAAVADWRAAEVLEEKQAKMGDKQVLELVRTPDILETLVKRKARQVIVGFAMETHQGVERARDKARRKSLDFIVLNYPAREHSPFGGEDNEVTLVRPEGEARALPLMKKREVAEIILDEVLALLQGRSDRA